VSAFHYRRSYRGPLRAAIFDWAGTTIDFGCLAPAGVFMDAFKRRGVPITAEEAREPMGAHKKVHIRKITELPSVAKRWREVHGKPSTDDDVEAMYLDFLPRQLECVTKYCELIPGALETIATIRKRGLKIGSTTGYTMEVMRLVVPEAKRRGYEPDSIICASDVPAGRPDPWMCFANAQNLRIFPMEAYVKIGDTPSDIDEGLNAGMWTIGLVKTGNEIGLSQDELARLPDEEYHRRRDRAYARLSQCGAHYVVDGIADIMPCFDEIDRRLASGERP
jgi:phosphonoacetaldehyde hydrolase